MIQRKIKVIMNPIIVDSVRDNTAGVWFIQYPDGKLKLECILYSKDKKKCMKDVTKELEGMVREYSSIDDQYIIGERTRLILNSYGFFMDMWCVNRTARIDPEIKEFVEKYPVDYGSDIEIEVSSGEKDLRMTFTGNQYPYQAQLTEFVNQKNRRLNTGDNILVAKARLIQMLTDMGATVYECD